MAGLTVAEFSSLDGTASVSSRAVDHGLINDIAICIVVAWIFAVTAQMLRQPLLLAYLVAGFVIGPVGIGLVKDHESIETISGIGLLLLLFMIGLEIDLKKMLSAGKPILLTSAFQIVGGCLLGLGYFRLLGMSMTSGSMEALYLSVAAALSSTVIIVKVLYEKRELDTFAGRLALGVLVLQDLFAILFLAVQPRLNDPSVFILLQSFGRVVLLVAVAFVASRHALRPLFRAVARLPELVLVGALAWCFLLAGLADLLGLSREMGALIAGVAISTFPYTLDVAAKVTSLRDFFVTLFFVALGMSVPAPSSFYLGWAAIMAAFVIFSRFVTVFPTLYGLRLGLRAAVLPSIYLAQVSELSLVILALGVAAHHIDKSVMGIAAYAFVLLGVGSTYAIVESDRLVISLITLLKRLGLRDLDGGESGERHSGGGSHQRGARVFLLGFSWTASSLLEEIIRKDQPLLNDLAVIDFNPVVHDKLKARGVRAIYGDITQRDTLIHAGVPEAEIIICTLPNTVLKGMTNLRLLQMLRQINPTAHVISHAELFTDVPRLYAAGASYVSVPRLIEAIELFEVLRAARNRMIDEKTGASQDELHDRDEVIP